MLTQGYPAYTTSCAWLGYSDDRLKQLCTEALKGGWTRFKVKVGADMQDDVRRCGLIRDMIGPEKTLVSSRLFHCQVSRLAGSLCSKLRHHFQARLN